MDCVCDKWIKADCFNQKKYDWSSEKVDMKKYDKVKGKVITIEGLYKNVECEKLFAENFGINGNFSSCK